MKPNVEREISMNNLINGGHGLNFFHRMLIVHIIYFVVKLSNAALARLGISDQHVPAEIVLGLKLDAKKDLRVRFRVDVEASCDSIITNDMLDRTHL